MKSIKDLRESYNLITEKEEHDMNKLSQLVRAGLFDAKKLSALKRAMEKPVDKMTAQEKRMMMNLLDSLMAEVLNDKQVYRKIKQDVMKEAMSDWETKDYFSKNDPRFGRGFPDQKQMPSVLLLKRKGIRVFPDGQKIGLYYAQAIDKYVSIPFEGINLSGHALHEETEDDDSPPRKTGRKILKPGEAGKAKWNIGGPKDKDDDNHPNAIRSRMDTLNRKANQAMLKDVRENFLSKLTTIREEVMLKPKPPTFSIPTEPSSPTLDKLKKTVFKRAKGIETRKNNPFRSSTEKNMERGRTFKTNKEKGLERQQRIKDKYDRFKTTERQPEKPKGLPKPDTKSNLPARNEPKTPSRFDQVLDKGKEAVKGAVISQASRALGPIGIALGAYFGSTRPAGDAKEREWELDKSKREPLLKNNKPAKIALGDKGSVNRLGKPQPKIKLTPDHTPSKVDLPSAKSEPQTSAAGKTDLQTSTKTDAATKTDLQTKTKTSDQYNQSVNRQDKTDKEDPAKKNEKPSQKSRGRPSAAGILGALAIGGAGAKGTPLTPNPTKLSLNVSAPKREGDPSAVASRQSALERKALKAQASMNESLDLDGNLFELNTKAAKKVSALYESLNKKNKKKMIEMMKESDESLEKVISFAVRQ